MNYYEPTKNATDAYYTDGTHKWFGKAAKGVSLTTAAWCIFKMEYTGDNWVIKYPVDPSTGLGTDAPKFIWGANGATAAGLTYNILGL